jgi:hypothetical protein
MRLVYLQIFFLTIGTAFSQDDCSKYGDDYVPKNLDDALTFLNCKWSSDEKENFKSKDERDAVSELHFGTGLSIRNSWELWEGKNSLTKYFNSIGIFHPDDISSIILTSFHRQLNNKDIELEKQLKYYKEYWDEARKAQKEIKFELSRQAKTEYETYGIGDNVKIAYTVSVNSGAVFAYRIQKHPDLGDAPNCFLKGIVKNKRVRKKKEYLVKILIMDICGHREAYGSSDKLVVGQEREFNVESFKIYPD